MCESWREMFGVKSLRRSVSVFPWPHAARDSQKKTFGAIMATSLQRSHGAPADGTANPVPSRIDRREIHKQTQRVYSYIGARTPTGAIVASESAGRLRCAASRADCGARGCFETERLKRSHGDWFCPSHLVGIETIRKDVLHDGSSRELKARRAEKRFRKRFDEAHDAYLERLERLHPKTPSERRPSSRYSLHNMHGARLCDAVGCRKHARLVERCGGRFCCEHAEMIEGLRKEWATRGDGSEEDIRAMEREMLLRKRFDDALFDALPKVEVLHASCIRTRASK